MVGGGGQHLAVAQRPSADSRTSPGTSWMLTTSRKSGPPDGNHTPHNGQPQRRAPLRRRPPLPAVRPAVRGGYRRSGRLHAPEAARTGPVSAFRPYFSWTPQGQWFNGQNGHFSCQPGRNHVGTPPGPYGSGFNGPRAVLLILPIKLSRTNRIDAPGQSGWGPGNPKSRV